MLASYAAAVALNGFLPADIGTLVMLLMFVTLIAGAIFAAVFSGFVIQKIPFTVPPQQPRRSASPSGRDLLDPPASLTFSPTEDCVIRFE